MSGPCPLIGVIEVLVDPVHDPAVGTGGFPLLAYDHMEGKRDKTEVMALRRDRPSGTHRRRSRPVVRDEPPSARIGAATSPVRQKDALMDAGDQQADTKSS